MWLILVGLTLLAGDVLSQANKVINSETDLLALESDQLIHSSAELLALEDQITGLPFGTKIPGYEKPIFAYSYTIKDNKQDQHLTTVHKPPVYNSNEPSKNFIYLQNLKLLNNGKKTVSLADKNTPTTGNDITTRSVNEENIKDEKSKDVSLLAQSTDSEFSEETQVSSDCDKLKTLKAKPFPSSDNLFSNDKSILHHTLDLNILPPEEKTTSSLFKNPSYSNTALNQDYLPPSSDELTLDYLPPEKSQTKINLNQDYLPPSKEIPFKPILTQDYLPPIIEKPNTPTLKLDYLPPKKEITTLDREYLPPRIEPIKTLNQNYLPPISESLNKPEKSLSKKEYTPSIPNQTSSINLSYLPPENKISVTKIENRLTIPINLDYLPPSDKSYTSSKLSQEYLPPIMEKLHKPNLPIGISRIIEPPNTPFALSANKLSPIENEKKISSGLASLTVYLPPTNEYQEYSPVTEKYKIKSIESMKPKTEYIHADDRSPSSVANPPIGLRRKENKVAPDVITEEVKDQPVLPKAEHSKVSPYSVIYEHKSKPVNALEDYSKQAPEPLASKNPEVSIKEIDRHPIKAVAKYSEISNYVPVEEEETPLISQAAYSKNKISVIATDVNINTNIDQPIRPLLGETHTTLSPIELVTSSNSKVKYSAPIAVHTNQVLNNKIVPISYYTKEPLSVTYDERRKIIPEKIPSKIKNVEIESDNPYMCFSNDHCPETCTCHNGECIVACSIAKYSCIGDARCETRNHVPACVCPLTFIAKTVQTSGSPQFDCEPMIMSASANTITDFSQKPLESRIYPVSCFIRYPTAPLRPISPISGFHQRPIIAPIRSTSSFVQSPISHQSSFVRGSGNACSPSPCGPNTRCEVNNRGIALCRCIDDYVPDGHTINGCKPQCTSDGECPDDYQCQSLKCVRVCVPGACGLYADCDARNHRAACSCPQGYTGDGHGPCSRTLPQVRTPVDLPVDPCHPNPCGSSADCRERGERAVCSCPIGYEGNPLDACIKGECIEHDDCPGHLACQGLRCIDPCVGVCGSGAECTVRSHQPVCSCPRNHIGDPFSNCRRLTEYDVCNPTPCGQNTNCKAKSERDGGLRAVCSCVDNYIGSPLTGCKPECTRDTDCSPSQNCQNNRCRNPCVNGCGEGAYCDVRNHQAVCSCPEHFLGDGHSRCYTECTEHDDCRDFEACSLFRCINPCEGSCGTGADCKVEKHTPICSCPRGYTGDPFQSCRAFTLEDLCRDKPCGTNAECHPGKDRSGNDRPVCTCPRGFIGNPLQSCRRGDCESHETCPDHQACYGYQCQSPCVTDKGSVCGLNADCKVKNHTPVCSCPRGYSGNPLDECRVSSSARIAGRSHRKQ